MFNISGFLILNCLLFALMTASWFHTWNGFRLTDVLPQEFICGISCLFYAFEIISCDVQR